MTQDPAGSYRQRTWKQREQAKRRHNRESAYILAQAADRRTVEARNAYRARQEKLLQGAELLLRRGTIQGKPLTTEQRKVAEEIALDATKALSRLL